MRTTERHTACWLAVCPLQEHTYANCGRRPLPQCLQTPAVFVIKTSLLNKNKKLRYREEHSASVVLSWCTSCNNINYPFLYRAVEGF